MKKKFTEAQIVAQSQMISRSRLMDEQRCERDGNDIDRTTSRTRETTREKVALRSAFPGRRRVGPRGFAPGSGLGQAEYRESERHGRHALPEPEELAPFRRHHAAEKSFFTHGLYPSDS